MINKEVLQQFIGPDGSGKLAAGQMFDAVSERLLDFLSGANTKPALPEFSRYEAEHFSFPAYGIGKDILSVVDEILNSAMNAANVKYIGHMDSIPALWSSLGDFIASAINNNMLSLEMSPYCTQLEYALISQFAEIFGLPKEAGGVMLSGGTLSNLQALTVARNYKLGLKDGNLVGLQKQPVIFCSEHAHVSLFKAGMVLGIGMDNVIKIKADKDSRMDCEDLIQKIRVSMSEGKLPFAVVATAGTTVTGSIDPLTEISLIAKKYNLWLHVDAIYGGALMFSSKHAYRLNGIGQADSISFNPQKWMYVAKTCSMVLFADGRTMREAVRVAAPYMKDQQEFTNLGEISIQGSRHAEVLKLYLTMLSIGKTGFSSLIEHSYFLKKIFLSEISSREYLELSTAGDTNIVCFRIRPSESGNQREDEVMKALQGCLLKEEGFFLSLPAYQGSLWLRCVLLNPFLNEPVVKMIFEKIDSFHADLA